MCPFRIKRSGLVSRLAGRLFCSSPQGLKITKPKAIIVLQKKGGGVETDRGEIMITDSTEFFYTLP